MKGVNKLIYASTHRIKDHEEEYGYVQKKYCKTSNEKLYHHCIGKITHNDRSSKFYLQMQFWSIIFWPTSLRIFYWISLVCEEYRHSWIIWQLKVMNKIGIVKIYTRLLLYAVTNTQWVTWRMCGSDLQLLVA